MNKKISALLLTLLFVVVTAVGCAPKTASNDTESAAARVEESKEITIKHQLGETTLKTNPKKVVVFDYGILDALDSMGVEIAALPKSSIPASLEKYKDSKYKDVGTLQEPNFEKIFELNPDLIIISGRQTNHYAELSKIAPTIFVTMPAQDYMTTFKANIDTLVQIFNKEDFVQKEVKAIEASVKALNEKAKASGKNSLVILANDGAISAYGEISRFGAIHNDFGFTPVDKNIQASTHGQSITFEYIVQKNPDILFVIDRAAIVGGSNTAQKVLDNDLIKTTTAYKNNKIIYLDAATWYTTTGGVNSTKKMISEIETAIK